MGCLKWGSGIVCFMQLITRVYGTISWLFGILIFGIATIATPSVSQGLTLQIPLITASLLIILLIIVMILLIGMIPVIMVIGPLIGFIIKKCHWGTDIAGYTMRHKTRKYYVGLLLRGLRYWWKYMRLSIDLCEFVGLVLNIFIAKWVI